MKTTNNNTAVAYIRVSSHKQLKGYSLDNQKESVSNFAKYKGLTLNKKDIYIERGCSAGAGKKRPEWDRLQMELDKGIIKNLVIVKITRLGRSAMKNLEFFDWCGKRNINVLSVSEGSLGGDSQGRLNRNLLSALAEYELDLITERAREGQLAAKEKGVKFGPKRRKGKLPKLDHAKVVELLQSGKQTVIDIAKIMNASRSRINVIRKLAIDTGKLVIA